MTTPANTSPASAPFHIGFTLKAASGFDAEWLTPRVQGYTAEEAAQRGAELLNAMKNAGLVELASKAAEFTRQQYKGGAGGGTAPKRFEGGKVVAKGSSGDAEDCPHGRKLFEKGDWAAMFCQAREKSDQCPPLWRQKDGSFKAK
ncbi:hypothetical protein OG401_14190 [Kitasatospora purpeofusca]|uniref:hypothetical protein n=1 Tax=Kitasatospora purpeofusca TaxID=67352 RepID=UPI00225B5421|nr:hypothetical protein [Kitasatospora purpeofusca]MCX4685451.1 hypothetical protein [Kitasatospora purpeofusca]